MGVFESIRTSMGRRRLTKDAASSDWSVAERAIKRIPGLLDTESALGILIAASRGSGSRLAGRIDNLPATPSFEFSANLHIRSAIAALGQIAHPAASSRLLEIIHELPNYTKAAIEALGSPAHAAAADRLAEISDSWPNEMRWRVAEALWRMQSEHAFALYVKIEKATGTPFSEDTMRRAWVSHSQKVPTTDSTNK